MIVHRISYEETKPFILGIHYARRMPSVSWAFGLFIEGRLMGVVTYGKPASPWLCVGIAGSKNASRVWELNRLVLHPEASGKNLASFLVGGSLRMLPGGLIIVSYADSAWGHLGLVYQATNFVYTGKTPERTDMASDAGHSRHNCGDPARRQLRSAKHRYHYVTGNRREKREVLKSILYTAKGYPKGKTNRYNPYAPVARDARFVLTAKETRAK